MELAELLTAVAGDTPCDCGKKHKLTTKIYMGDEGGTKLYEECAALVPPLSRIALIGRDERFLFGATDALKRDFRIFTADGERTKLPEDTKLVVDIGIGGAGRVLAAKADLPVVVFSFPHVRCLVPAVAACSDGVTDVFRLPPPDAFVCDTNIPIKGGEQASLLGGIAARLCSLFDYEASAVMNGGHFCKTIHDSAFDTVSKFLLTSAELPRNSQKLKTLIFESSLSLSAHAALLGDSRLVLGGETQCAYALDSIERRQGTEGRSLGEKEFLFAAAVCALYKSRLSAKSAFLPPPDNNLRLEKLSEILKLDEYTLLKFMLPQLSSYERGKLEYKWELYKKSFLEKVDVCLSLLKLAARTFKKLYDDDGYAISKYLPKDLMYFCMAAAPDLQHKFTFLTLLRRRGELDRLLAFY